MKGSYISLSSGTSSTVYPKSSTSFCNGRDSTGFQKDMEDFGYTVEDVPELKEMYEQCMPLYEKMYAERLKP